MATKTEIKALQDANLASGSGIPASNHRAVLNTDPDSVLENIYGAPVQDYSEGTHAITTPNENFTYFANFSKVGRLVTVTGTFTALATLGANSTIFTIDADDHICISERFHGSAQKITVSSYVSVGLYIVNNELRTRQLVLEGEIFNYTITYSTLN